MRPIDADALKERAMEMEIFMPYGGDGTTMAVEVYSIDHMPTLDYAPVVHGEWKYFHKQNIAVCTVCSFERDLDADFGRAVSCPNCGAKMDSQK